MHKFLILLGLVVGLGSSGVATIASAGNTETASEQPAGDAVKGKKVFKKCRACHKLEAGKKGVGPTLFGIIGRPAASVEGYKYSAAMKSSGLTWDLETLHAYLKKPKDLVPKTKMTFAGLKKDKDIVNLLAYLAEAAH